MKTKVAIVLISAILVNFTIHHYENVAEAITGVPSEIVKEAVNSGGISVYLLGTEEEKHSFGKGQQTRYGKMSFDADAYLKYNKGWSEKKIHQLGHKYGFSKELK